MIDFSDIPDEMLKARGMYSTVRKEHEAQLRLLQETCQDTITNVTKLLQAAQRQPLSTGLLASCFDSLRSNVSVINERINVVTELYLQKAELRPRAWEE